jgi:hypothetical protein
MIIPWSSDRYAGEGTRVCMLTESAKPHLPNIPGIDSSRARSAIVSPGR